MSFPPNTIPSIVCVVVLEELLSAVVKKFASSLRSHLSQSAEHLKPETSLRLSLSDALFHGTRMGSSTIASYVTS